MMMVNMIYRQWISIRVYAILIGMITPLSYQILRAGGDALIF